MSIKMMKNRSTAIRYLFMALGLVATGSSLRAEFIDTMPLWNGSDIVYNFGEVNTATYGQTITTNGTDYLLENFSFLINTASSAPTNFQAYVMQWDSQNGRATGSLLFQSVAFSNPPTPGFNEINVPVGLTLAPNSEYVLFFSASMQFDGVSDEARFARVIDSYSGGRFVFINNGSDLGALTTLAWTTNWIGNDDLAFKARLAVVPEPASWVILSSGILLSLSYARRKRLAKA